MESNRGLYERYKLLNKAGGIRIVANPHLKNKAAEDTQRQVNSLNRSPYYVFEARLTSDNNSRILIFENSADYIGKQLSLFSPAVKTDTDNKINEMIINGEITFTNDNNIQCK